MTQDEIIAMGDLAWAWYIERRKAMAGPWIGDLQ